ncbi:MAG: hypothetical protein M1839_004905 [Geoglossum umbratile]|nr:MAG: hypothetical protein M1839_004905 [Geoglossum umbratile]
MASTQLSLNLKCLAQLPMVHFDAQLMADAEYFVDQGPYKQQEVVMQFAISVKHHLEILLKPTLKMFQEGLESHRNIKASEDFLDGKIPTIGSLLEQMEDSFVGLELGWTLVKLTAGLDLSVLPGSIVPTASPRELLINLLVNRPSVLQKIAAGGDTVLATY